MVYLAGCTALVQTFCIFKIFGGCAVEQGSGWNK